MTSSPSEISVALQRLKKGDSFTFEDLLPLVYGRLRMQAGGFFLGVGNRHTLQATALVHETYLKLKQTPLVEWEGRAHFFATAARAMRSVMLDHYKASQALKRGGNWKRKALDPQVVSSDGSLSYDLLDLNDALDALSEEFPRAGNVVELRFFAGFTNQESAEALGVTTRTIERDWRFAQAWLANRME